MDQEVAKTLGELELKLQELEHELTSISRREASPERNGPRSQLNDMRSEPASVPGRLVDEAVEHAGGITGGDGQARVETEMSVEETAADNAFGGPAVWGGEEVPAQAGATIERDWTVEARETAYGEIPTPPATAETSNPPYAPSWPSPSPPLPPPLPQPHHPYASTPPEREAIDVADLVRFKEKMQRTMDELIDEYGRLLSLRPPS